MSDSTWQVHADQRTNPDVYYRCMTINWQQCLFARLSLITHLKFKLPFSHLRYLSQQRGQKLRLPL